MVIIGRTSHRNMSKISQKNFGTPIFMFGTKIDVIYFESVKRK